MDVRRVYGEQINQIRPEGVFGGEANLLALGLDELDDFDGRVLDVGHVLSVGMLSQEGARANDDIKSIHTGLSQSEHGAGEYTAQIKTHLHRDLGVLQVASHMGKDLGFESEL